MEKKYSSEVPVKVERKGTKRTLNYGVQELGESEIKELWDKAQQEDTSYEVFARQHKYGYWSVEVPMGQWRYDGVINAIIREKYRSDEMEAINNNATASFAEFLNELVRDGILSATKHLVENIKEDNQEAFKEMQEWRALAKKEAKEVFNVK